MTGRDRIVLMVVVALAAVVGSWLMVIQPKRNEASKLGSQVTQAQTDLSNAQALVAAGQAAKSSFPKYYGELSRLGEAVPEDDNVPSLIVQLQSAARQSGVDFRTLVLSPSSGGSAAASGGAAGPLPPGVTTGPAGLPIEGFTFTFTGNFFHLSNFFGRLQRFVIATDKRLAVSGRLLSLNAINFSPGPNGFPRITASVNATTYLAPVGQGATAGATPSGPAGSSPTTPAGAAASASAAGSSSSPTPAPTAAATP